MDSFLTRREQPGLAGFARQDAQPGEAYWLENLDIDRNGTYHPRWGTKHIKSFSTGNVTSMSRPAGYNHHLMVVADGGTLYDLDIESPSSPTSLDTGWPQLPIATAIVPTLTGMSWAAAKAAISGSAGDIVAYDGSSLTTLSAADGNAVGVLINCLLRVVSGIGGPTALQWSDDGDITTWPATRQRSPIPQLNTVDMALSLTARETILFGPSGVGRVFGDSGQPEDLSWQPVWSGQIATPMYHPVLCGDRIVFAVAGPSIYELVGGGVPRRIDPPIGRDLFLAAGVRNTRWWYLPSRRELLITDLAQHITYRYGIDEGLWKGVYTFTNSDDFIGGATIDQGASAVDEGDMPWAKEFVAAGKRVLQWDPSLSTDATDGSTNVAFTCAIESRSTEPEVGYEKQLTELQVDGYGTFTVKLRHRSSPDADWTTVTLGTVTAPGIFYPALADMPVYRERVIRLEADSDEDLRFRSMKPYERIVGEPLS